MKNLWLRLTGDTPKFFKKVIAIGASLTATGTAIIGLPAALAAAGVSIAFPPSIVAVGGYLIAAGAVAAVVGKLTITDTSILEKKD